MFGMTTYKNYLIIQRSLPTDNITALPRDNIDRLGSEILHCFDLYQLINNEMIYKGFYNVSSVEELKKRL